MIDKVSVTIRREEMLEAGGAAVLAVSGGPDSLALLHAVCAIRNREYPAVSLHVGHLHHGIRGAEAEADAEFVRAESARLGLPCTIERADVPALARARGIGVELAGREARYAFLTRLASSLAASRILMGHQADDQVETVLMRVRRGAGPRGVAAIPFTRTIEEAPGVLLARPLLDCTRAEIEAFLRARGLHARLDATNLSMDYLRNRMRARIIPRLRQLWTGGLAEDVIGLAQAAQRLQRQAGRLTKTLTGLHAVRFAPEMVETELGWLRALPAEMAPELIHRWMRQAGLRRKALGAPDYQRIRALLVRARGCVALPGSVLACSDGRVFALTADWRDRPPFSVPVAVPGVTPIEPLNAGLESEIIEGAGDWRARRPAKGKFEEYMDFDRLDGPLEMRFVRAGDRMQPLGSPGRRKLYDILTDLHVPRWRRSRSLVLTAHGKPVWLVGWRMAEGVKITAATRRLAHFRIPGACAPPESE